jgi:hypothetical protein
VKNKNFYGNIYMSLPAEYNEAYKLSDHHEDHEKKPLHIDSKTYDEEIEKNFNFKNLVLLFIGKDMLSELYLIKNEYDEELANQSEEDKKETKKKSKITFGRIFLLFINLYSIYLCFKCNERPSIIEILISLTFPILYIMFKLGTNFDKCFPIIGPIEPQREVIKVL